jgi:5'-deoxy-5'-methylthioadenosine phosphorylase
VKGLAIIGGTGLAFLEGLEGVRREVVNTPYGEPSAPLVHGTLRGVPVTFLARHGTGHTIPPHEVNYRANIWAFKQAGLDHVLAVAAVGAIAPGLLPGQLVVPEQIVDYTWGRHHTFFEGGSSQVVHVDFSFPYCRHMRALLLDAGHRAGVDIRDGGTYGATQGPRLESAAEIDRMERDGCTLVGMTGMPEAALAREAELRYATCAVVANHAAGRAGDRLISLAEIDAALRDGMRSVRALLGELAGLMAAEPPPV